MEVIWDILKKASAGELTLTAALILVCISLSWFFYREIKQLYKDHKADMQKAHDECTSRYDAIYCKYRDDNDKIIKQMFEITMKNTESNTKLSEAVRDLSNKL